MTASLSKVIVRLVPALVLSFILITVVVMAQPIQDPVAPSSTPEPPTTDALPSPTTTAEILLDADGCQYRGPEPLASEHTNLVSVSLRNAGNVSALFVVIGLPADGRFEDLEAFYAGEFFGEQLVPSWAEIRARNTVAPNTAVVMTMQIRGGRHVFACFEDPADVGLDRPSLSPLVDFVSATPVSSTDR